MVLSISSAKNTKAAYGLAAKQEAADFDSKLQDASKSVNDADLKESGKNEKAQDEKKITEYLDKLKHVSVCKFCGAIYLTQTVQICTKCSKDMNADAGDNAANIKKIKETNPNDKEASSKALKNPETAGENLIA